MSTSQDLMLAPQPRKAPSHKSPGQGAAADRPTAPAISRGIVRLGIAKEIPDVLRNLGADPDWPIQQAGVDPLLFQDSNNVIALAELGRLLAACVAHANCPHFGLLLGQRAVISALGPVGGLMLHSQSAGEALRALISHLHLRERGTTLLLKFSDGVAMLCHAVHEPGVESTDQIADAAIGTLTRIMRSLCGQEWTPDEVFLPRLPPADLEPYRRFFRAPIWFDQEMAALAFPVRWLDHRIPGADPVFRQFFETRIRELESVHDADFKDDLRRVLRTRIMNGQCSAETIADLFAMHRRTLSRHLHAEGTGFRHLADEIRFDIARQLLIDTNISLSQIAAALGYSEASAFTRAFRRWSGGPPAAWRAEHRRPRAPLSSNSSRVA